jgi:acetyl-CoA carboxylase biotin carboxyl carrier protein
MDLRKLKTLIDLVSESNVSELEITEAEGKVRIVKTPGVGAMPAQPFVMSGYPQGAVQAAPAVAAPVAAVPVAEPVDEGHVLKSPMVGTFYRSSSPGAKPLVEVGDTVKEGQVLCIIEAMKIMNEVESDKAGVIKKIFATNSQAVEYGQPLFIIE